MNPATHRLRALILEGQLEPPLPPDIPREDALSAFGEPSKVETRYLGLHVLERARFTLEGRPQPVDLWLDGARLVLVDYAEPVLTEPLEALLERLGEPAARTMALRTPPGTTGRLWAWPERGLTLSLGARTEDARDPAALTKPSLALHLYAYPATDLRGWKALGVGTAGSKKRTL